LTASTSTDGTTWSNLILINNATTGVTDIAYGIAYGDSTYVVVGGSNSTNWIWTSTDGGATWTGQGKPSSMGTNYFNTVAYGEISGSKIFVAGGIGGKIYYSIDKGATWTAGSSGSTSAINKIIFADNKFIAVGANGKYWTSPDGINFTASTPTGLTTSTIKNIAWNGGNNFILVGAGVLQYSSNKGSSWTTNVQKAFPSGYANSINAVAFGGGKFAVGGAQGTIPYSQDDGVSWIDTLPTDISKPINAIAFGNGKFVAVTETGKMWYLPQ
jgi:hypothetical protein